MNHLAKLEKSLVALNNSSANSLKSPNGAKISESLVLMKNIFLSFFEVGVSPEATTLIAATNSDVQKVKSNLASIITKHSEWMQHYIPIYARDALDFQSENSDENVYKVRSGIEFMFTLLKSTSPQFDVVLSDIHKYSTIDDEFDENMKSWIECGAHVHVKSLEIPKNIPANHWWWLKAS